MNDDWKKAVQAIASAAVAQQRSDALAVALRASNDFNYSAEQRALGRGAPAHGQSRCRAG